ncbi:MAG: RND family efflux transporter MFP subunit [Cycloclasticus pugetii]|jgi:RND family efflux transporter MFP subunit|uniref:Efflux transporter, RND family, MFP subunit n=3 Tax=Cycloclasticus TaxID=34067 RepID=S5THE1_9GAMM|nr:MULTISPECIES: HlyD family secretion protein [Cycloclasticus]AGS40282.1 Efflux transporter, RND family, MFP subunit [Cycloclasticus zancles 78-ME]ATI03694.1 HlyD family secretion protein [Cycloclasticus sp. PY97N]EPD14185.1 Efflux transporter, RND family, MFP subunit [Cycloclasticus pugetii]MBV1898232.1 HlyD family secretion protein [Cycloclasticus sp.]MDF1828680.1 HlyD family secretion protein [Cycloclasticus pugetii]
MQKEKTIHILKVMMTCTLTVLAAFVLWHIYSYYTYTPQTRDGKIKADIVALSSDVSGQVEAVFVQDNQQVQKGDVLFSIDTDRLENTVAQNEAALSNARATLAAANREEKRYKTLKNTIVSEQERDNRISVAEQAQAKYEQALADLKLARLNLERSQVKSPINGIVTNFSLRPGTYATAGQPVMALVDIDSFYVAGYFEETKLSHIRTGMPATVHIMGEDQAISGHVVGISSAIEDRERATSSNTLIANVNPTFNWIRLAQRVPVRIAIDEIPDNIALISGRTASITINNHEG